MTVQPQPSRRYQALVTQYARMHLEGDRQHAVPPEKLFDGRALTPHIETLRQLLARTQSSSLLDYGCGKAAAYDATRAEHPDGSVTQGLQALWGLRRVAFYDPAVRAHAALPQGQFDAVVATAVLEYVPEEDVEWVLAEIVGYATRLVFVTLACHPSAWTLPSGENYHVTQKSPGWWTDRLLAARPLDGGPRLFAFLYTSERRRVLLEI